MMNCHYLSFLIDEIWLDLQDNIFYSPYLWETSYNRSLGDPHSGLTPKSLNAGVKRP